MSGRIAQISLSIALLVMLAIAAGFADTSLYHQQFNPITLNLAMIGLALVAWIVSGELPTARRCLRKPSEDEP